MCESVYVLAYKNLSLLVYVLLFVLSYTDVFCAHILMKSYTSDRFTVSLVYYGVSFNAGAFGDVFLNTFLSGLIEIPANLLCYLCLDKIGRRWPNGGTLLVTAVIELSLVPILLVRPG